VGLPVGLRRGSAQHLLQELPQRRMAVAIGRQDLSKSAADVHGVFLFAGGRRNNMRL